MPVLKLPLKSGINNQDSIGFDELLEAVDVGFDEEGQLSTRRGTANFGNPVPDTVVELNTCDATTNWTATNDAANVAQDSSTNRREAASVEFDVDVSADASNNFATLTNANLNNGASGIDISSAKGYLGYHFYVPALGTTNFTSIEVRLGSDSSNYYKWTILVADLTANKYHFFRLNYADATSVGTPVDTVIDYFQTILTYAAGYIDVNNWQIDDIRSYSASSTKPITSYFSHKRDDKPLAVGLIERMAICVAGTNAYEYDETSESWNLITSGLTFTEFETAVGRTTERTRWAFAAYRNAISMSNGIDSYRIYDGRVITEYAGVKKYRTLVYQKGADKVLGSGADDQPLTLDYTNPAAANAQTLPNSLVVGGDEKGVRVNILDTITVDNGSLTLAFTHNQVFVINTTSGSESSTPINTQNGGYSQRTVREVGNAFLYETDNGIDRLKYKRSSAGGGEALESDPFTEKQQDFIRKIIVKQLNANAAWYAKSLKNYYFSFDTNGDNKPDTTLVYSSLVSNRKKRVWTQYNWTSAYDYGEFEDSSGELRYLLASAVSGQMVEVETGFDDDGVEIIFRLSTGDVDPINPKNRNLTQFKSFEWFDIVGKMNVGGVINGQIFVGQDIVRSFQITDSNLDTDITATPIGTKPIGTLPVGGGGTEGDIDLFPYTKRIPLWGVMGPTIKVVLTGSITLLMAKFRQMLVSADGESFDLIPSSMLD